MPRWNKIEPESGRIIEPEEQNAENESLRIYAHVEVYVHSENKCKISEPEAI